MNSKRYFMKKSLVTSCMCIGPQLEGGIHIDKWQEIIFLNICFCRALRLYNYTEQKVNMVLLNRKISKADETQIF